MSPDFAIGSSAYQLIMNSVLDRGYEVIDVKTVHTSHSKYDAKDHYSESKGNAYECTFSTANKVLVIEIRNFGPHDNAIQERCRILVKLWLAMGQIDTGVTMFEGFDVFVSHHRDHAFGTTLKGTIKIEGLYSRIILE